MAQDNATPADEGRIAQARRLAEQGLAAGGRGIERRRTGCWTKRPKLDPQAVEDVLEEARGGR